MAMTRASTARDQHNSPSAAQQAPQGPRGSQQQPDQRPESNPSLHRFLGNSYLQALPATIARPDGQTTLGVNEPGDCYEQEADRVADKVMAVSTQSSSSEARPRIRRVVGQAQGQTETVPASVRATLANPGSSLESALREDMEQRFGYDFSAIRVHTGAAADQSARDMNAHAYTLGHNIVFARGRFAPQTRAGRQLLAHELTHVVQQALAGSNSAVSGLIQRQPADTPPTQKPARRQRTDQERLWPVAFSDGRPLPEAITDFVPRILSVVNGARYKPVRGVQYAHGATQAEELWAGKVSMAKLIARDVIYYFSGDGTLLEVESNLSQPIDPAKPDELPAPKTPLPSEGIVLIAEPATKRKWQMFQQTSGRHEMLPFAGTLSLPGGASAGQLIVFIYAPGHSASEDGGPQPGYKAKGLKEVTEEKHRWAEKQYSRVMRRLESAAKVEKDGKEAPAGTGTGMAGEGLGGGGKDPLGQGTGASGTGIGAATAVGGKGRGGDKPQRDRAKPDKVAYYVGKHGPTLNVWKGKSHEAIPLKPGEKDDDLVKRIEEAAARQQSTGKRIADSATKTGIVGGQGGQGSRIATAEEIAEATNLTANAPAYPSRMEMQGGSIAEVSPNGWGTTVTGAKHDFDMILDWDAIHSGLANQVFARLGWVNYFWQVIDISKLDLGGESKTQGEFEQEDVFRQRMRKQARIGAQDETKVRKATTLEGFKETVSDVAAIKWEEAKEDAPDLVSADTVVTWPAKAAKLSLIALDTAWSVGKALLGAWVSKITEPENRREIAFGQSGEFLIRCLANPHPDKDKPYEQQTRRATSIAVFPVRVVDINKRAQEVTSEEKSQLEQVRMLVADLQKQLAANPTNEGLQSALEVAQLMLSSQQASYGRSTVEKVAYELESYDKQIAVLEKLKDPKSSIDDLRGEERSIAFDLKEEIAKKLKRGPRGFVAWYDYEFHLYDVKEARKKKAEQKEITEKKAGAVEQGTALRPRVAFVSEENGALVRMEMILGRAKGSNDENPKWILADVTTPDTARSYDGSSSTAGIEGDKEAVTKAFEAFAEKAEYGRGTISIEIPARADLIKSGTTMLMKPGEAIRWRGRLRSLIEVAGLVAPYVKGGQLIGRLAAIGGALDAGERLYDRAVNDRLKANFETLVDVVTVLTPMAHGAAALSTKLPKTSSGAYVLRTFGKTIDYANEFMMPATFVHDLDQIMRDTSLGGPEKKAAIVMLFGRGLRDGTVQYVRVKGSHPVNAPAPAEPLAGRAPVVPGGEVVRPTTVEGGATPTRQPTARQKGIHERFDLSDVQGPAEPTQEMTRPRQSETQRIRSAETDKPPEPPPGEGQQPVKEQGPKAGEAGSTPVPEHIRKIREEQARRAEAWQVDAETLALAASPDARARAHAAEFTPTFAQWNILGVAGRRARIERLINTHLKREGIPPVKVEWGDKTPGSAEFVFHEWKIILSEKVISAKTISVEDFATLVDNAAHEGRHTVTTFRGMRVALADNNYNPSTGVPGKILAKAIEANRRKSPSDELSAEALGEAREIYEVGFAQDQRRAELGTEGVVDREAIYDRKKAATEQLDQAKAAHEAMVAEVRRLENEGKRGSADHLEALRKVVAANQVWMKAYQEHVAAHNEYVALPEETASWRAGSSVKAAVLERLALQARLNDLQRQYEKASVEQAQKRQAGDREGADKALARSREAQRKINETKAEIKGLVSKEPARGEVKPSQTAPQSKNMPPAAKPEATEAPAKPGTTEDTGGEPAPKTPKPAETTPPGSRPPALSLEEQGQARQEWQKALLEELQPGKKGVITQKSVAGVRFVGVKVSRVGPELQVSYLIVSRIDPQGVETAPKGAGILVHDALEQAAVQVGRQTNASSVQITVRHVGHEGLRKNLKDRQYEVTKDSEQLPEDERSWAKVIPVVPPTAATDPTPTGKPPKISSAQAEPPPSGPPPPSATSLPPGADTEPTLTDIRRLPPEAEPTEPHIEELPEVEDTLVEFPLGEIDGNEPTQVDIPIPPPRDTIRSTPPPPPSATSLPPGADTEPTLTDIRRLPPEAEPTEPHIEELPEVEDTLVEFPLGEIDGNDPTQVDIPIPPPPRDTIRSTPPPPPPAPPPSPRRTLRATPPPPPPPPPRRPTPPPPPPPPRRTIQHTAPPPPRSVEPPLVWGALPEAVAQRIEALRTSYQQLAPTLIENYQDWLAVRATLDPQLGSFPLWTVDMITLDREFFAITEAIAERYQLPFNEAWNRLAAFLDFNPELWPAE